MSVTKSDTRAMVAVLAALLWPLASPAHIKNEATQFPDIEYSPARFDIVALVGVGIIPETPVFEPDKPLSRQELATWAALAANLRPGGETPDVDALARAARDAGLVEDLEGSATLADIDRLLFDDKLSPEDPARTPTKAEAASLVAARLDSEAGDALLARRQLSFGPVGVVNDVSAAEGHHGGAYVVTVGDTALPVNAHGRVANGPTDLLQWRGLTVRRTILRGEADEREWIYLEARPAEQEEPAAAVSDAPQVAPEPEPEQRRLLYWLIAAVLILGIGLFFRRRR